MCITALKIPKLNIFFLGKTLPFYTAFGEASGAGPLCEARGSRFCRSWRWGCAEEWLGLKGPAQVRLAYARCKQGTKP
jgi:hypothetical protein